MLSFVLFVLCLAVTPIVAVMHHHAIKLVEHIPAVQRVVRQCANISVLVALLYVVLWLVGTNLNGVSPVFGPTAIVSCVLTSLVLGWQNLRYARKHLPAFD